MEGFEIFPNIISETEELFLIEQIEKNEWDFSIKRATQHYGYKYSYKSGEQLQPAPPPPPYLIDLLGKIDIYFGLNVPNQIIINKYLPGEGISPHIDDTKKFGDYVLAVSLGSDVVMKFSNSNETIDVLIPRRSAYIMRRDARYKYYHSIPSRLSDNGVKRKTRISITYRNVI